MGIGIGLAKMLAGASQGAADEMKRQKTVQEEADRLQKQQDFQMGLQRMMQQFQAGQQENQQAFSAGEAEKARGFQAERDDKTRTWQLEDRAKEGVLKLDEQQRKEASDSMTRAMELRKGGQLDAARDAYNAGAKVLGMPQVERFVEVNDAGKHFSVTKFDDGSAALVNERTGETKFIKDPASKTLSPEDAALKGAQTEQAKAAAAEHRAGASLKSRGLGQGRATVKAGKDPLDRANAEAMTWARGQGLDAGNDADFEEIKSHRDGLLKLYETGGSGRAPAAAAAVPAKPTPEILQKMPIGRWITSPAGRQYYRTGEKLWTMQGGQVVEVK